MDSSEINANQNKSNNEKILIKKSLFNALIVTVVAASLIAAFLAGSYINLKSSEMTKSELTDVITKLEKEILKNQQSDVQPNIKPIMISIDDDPIRGDPNAPITIVEFSDFQCPFCARFHVQTLPLILEEYTESGKVRFVYRDFPIQSHPNAMPAAVASECAHEQDKYWQYHDVLFENQVLWSNMEIPDAITVFKEFATRLELNQNQFNACLDSGKYIEEVNKDLNDGRNYGVSGTPGFFIGNEKIGFIKINGAQPFESFKTIIDHQLNT